MLPRVVYLSAPPYSGHMLDWLMTQPCEVVAATIIDAKVIDWVKYWDTPYDIGLNFLGSYRIPAEEIIKPRLGWVNFHPAPLPEFGGRNVAYHAIMEGAKEFGATVHYMSEKIDHGDLIEVARFPILDTDTAGSILRESHFELQRLFHKWVPMLLKERVPAVSQEGKTRYYRKTDIDDFITFTPEQKLQLRALTCHPKYHARVALSDGVWYRIVPEDE